MCVSFTNNFFFRFDNFSSDDQIQQTKMIEIKKNLKRNIFSLFLKFFICRLEFFHMWWYNFPICLVQFSIWEWEEMNGFFFYFSPFERHHLAARTTTYWLYASGCVFAWLFVVMLTGDFSMSHFCSFSLALFHSLTILSSIKHKLFSRNCHEFQQKQQQQINKHITLSVYQKEKKNFFAFIYR